MSTDYSEALKAFDAELERHSMRGQWAPNAPPTEGLEGPTGAPGEPAPGGLPYIWHWKDYAPLVDRSCEALPNSFTARRALGFRNPLLHKTAQTLQMAIQVIRPHEIAWAHRHTIAALRFVLKGSKDLYTVVDGVAYPMEENDLVLTPSWSWHDHHNDTDEVLMWLDVLDVPLVGSLRQGFYEEFGKSTQPIRNRAVYVGSGLRDAWGQDGVTGAEHCYYPWRETEAALSAHEGEPGSPYDGTILDYVNRGTLGPTMPTLNCQIQRLPPGFRGRPHRHTSSAVYFVVRGRGATDAGDTKMEWSRWDGFVVPNWTWHRHANASETEDALLFTVTDAPVLQALGYYREQAG